mmetsp:Transcript_22464/g.38050  ORF Transcript_22464/g.38050 Transcript_22464/m.38050 type:complete len:208 (-) Transcript_22464:35-658(-)
MATTRAAHQSTQRNSSSASIVRSALRRRRRLTPTIITAAPIWLASRRTTPRRLVRARSLRRRALRCPVWRPCCACSTWSGSAGTRRSLNSTRSIAKACCCSATTICSRWASRPKVRASNCSPTSTIGVRSHRPCHSPHHQCRLPTPHRRRAAANNSSRLAHAPARPIKHSTPMMMTTTTTTTMLMMTLPPPPLPPLSLLHATKCIHI